MRVREHFWKLKSPKFAPRLRANTIWKSKSLKTAGARKLKSPKFAPRLRARTIWKSKSLKTEGARALLEVNVAKICTTPARENDLEVKIVKTPGSRTTFWGSKCFSCGRRRDFDMFQNAWQAHEFVRVAKTLAGVVALKRLGNDAFRVAEGKDFVLCDVDGWSLRRRIRGRVANFMSRKCYFAVIISRGSYRTSYASAQLFRGRRNTFEGSTWKSFKRIVILRSSVRSTCHFWRKSRRNASFLMFEDVRSFILEGSLAQKLRFWISKVQFWRMSRKKATFSIFKASFLKEVSHKSFVFDLQSFIFEGSLAQKLRFWASKLHFWRKSRRNASFLIFKASFLKEVSRKSLFLRFKASFLKEVSQICFVSDQAVSYLVSRSVTKAVSQ